MKWAGLTGGIGCGKTTVAARLTALGAIPIDVDQLSRQLQRPGQAVFAAMVARWGERVVAADGALNRQAVAEITFNDRDEMSALMEMTSTAIEDAIEEIVAQHAESESVLLLESALLRPGLYGISGLVVVDVPEDVALDRLVHLRGMTESDVRSRMAHQPSREERRSNAGFIIDNRGDEPSLDEQVAGAWQWLHTLPDGAFRRRT